MNRKEYVARLKVQLDEWNVQLDQLESRAQQATAEARAQYEDQIAALRRHQDAASQRLAELKQAQEGAWDELRQGCESAFAALKEGVERARAHFK